MAATTYKITLADNGSGEATSSAGDYVTITSDKTMHIYPPEERTTHIKEKAIGKANRASARLTMISLVFGLGTGYCASSMMTPTPDDVAQDHELALIYTDLSKQLETRSPAKNGSVTLDFSNAPSWTKACTGQSTDIPENNIVIPARQKTDTLRCFNDSSANLAKPYAEVKQEFEDHIKPTTYLLFSVCSLAIGMGIAYLAYPGKIENLEAVLLDQANKKLKAAIAKQIEAGDYSKPERAGTTQKPNLATSRL